MHVVIRSRIIGTGSYLPSRIVTNEEVSEGLALNADAIFRRTGIRTRRWVEQGQTSSSLGEEAGRRALEAAALSPSAIDGILVSTTSPDMMMPSTACHVQQRLGCRDILAFDVAASCSGFLYALSMADSMLRSGMLQTCLVVAAEVKSRFLDPADEATSILFADGAGAVVLRREVSAAPQSSGLVGSRLYADGAQHHLISLPAGGSCQPTTAKTLSDRQHYLRIQGGPLFRSAVKRLGAAVQDILKDYSVTMDDVSQTVFHQANGRLLSALEKRLCIPPHKSFSVIEHFGNASSASLPIALDYAVRQGRIHSGDLVLLGAFGGGLTWATALLRW